MKTLKHTLFLFAILIAHSTFAQTKEETVKYIQNILSLSNGNGDKSNLLVLDQKFNLNLVVTKTRINEIVGEIKQDVDKTVSISEIPWLEAFILEEISISGGLVHFGISFNNKAKAKEVEKSFFHHFNKTIESDEEFTNIFVLYVVNGKVENFKKAFTHLIELLKKEDPFGN